MVELTREAALARAEALAASGGRRLLGIAGAPGAGKSTLAAAVAARLGDRSRVVGMDGFHLAQAELERLGRADRKGAPETFDRAGYAALLRRLRAREDEVVLAPLFRRDLEEPVGSAVAVPSTVPLVVTEGNYLLLWDDVRALLDETWFVEVDDALRLQRLIARHVAFGRSRAAAEAWVRRSDERNAAVVAATRSRADAVVRPGIARDRG